MCGPLAPFIALAAAGTVAQYIGNTQAQSATTRAMQAERARQQGFTQQQDALWRDSLSKAEQMATPESQEAAVEERRTPLVAAMTNGGEGQYLPGSGSAAPIVRSSADGENQRSQAASTERAGALARMGAFGDQMLDTSIATGRNAQQIGQIASFMQGSNAALQPELDAAAQKGGLLRGLGGLAQQIGMAAISGGAGGAAKGAAGGAKIMAGMTPTQAALDWRVLLPGNQPDPRGVLAGMF